MIYQAARWRKRGVGSGGDGGVGGGGAAGGLEGGGRCSAAIAMVNRAANKGASISPDVDGDSDLVRAKADISSLFERSWSAQKRLQFELCFLPQVTNNHRISAIQQLRELSELGIRQE